MKKDYVMNYNDPFNSGKLAHLRGHAQQDNPVTLKVNATAHKLWVDGWIAQSKNKCKGVELLPRNYTGCTASYSDCPVCGL